MYALTSTAGLNTTAPTVEQAATILGQHLHDLAPDGPIHWTITAHWGGVPHTGHLRLNGLPDDGFIADAIAEVTEDLRAGQSAHRHVIAGQP